MQVTLVPAIYGPVRTSKVVQHEQAVVYNIVPPSSMDVLVSVRMLPETQPQATDTRPLLETTTIVAR